MPLRVNHNIASISTRRFMDINSRDLAVRLERLSSGLRIVRAADDAAGLTVSESMRAEISGLRQNLRNAEMANDMLLVADGSLNEINSILIRLRELAVQSASSTYSDTNRDAVQAEYSQLVSEIDRIAESTVYNDVVLLTGAGNTISSGSTASGSASSTTGVTRVTLSGADAGTYTFVDASSTDNQITLGNGVITVMCSVAAVLKRSIPCSQ